MYSSSHQEGCPFWQVALIPGFDVLKSIHLTIHSLGPACGIALQSCFPVPPFS